MINTSMKYSLLWLLVASTALAGSQEAYKALRATTLRFDVGSGSLVRGASGALYMLTNFHVCNASVQDTYMLGALPDGTSFLGRITKSDIAFDLCAIRVQGSGGLSLAREFPLHGDLFSRGYPHLVLAEVTGKFVAAHDWTHMYSPEELFECPAKSTAQYENGSFSGCLVTQVNYVTTLFVRPGSSGSPVVDSDGNLVGVVDSYSYAPVGPNAAHAGIVPFYQVKEFLSNL